MVGIEEEKGHDEIERQEKIFQKLKERFTK